MLDVEARASVGAQGARSDGGELAAWVEQRRPVVVGGAFAVAVLIGVVIGLLTAPSATPAAKVEPSPPPVAAELSPPLPDVTWATSRQPGAAHQMFVTKERDPAAFRLALSWAVAEQLRQTTGTQALRASDVTIPDGMYYGAIEGADASSDVFWAVGETEVAAVTQPNDPFVWKRVGAGPWQIVASGPGACSQLPSSLFAVWKGRPAMCGRS
jgi:hypothetical protein